MWVMTGFEIYFRDDYITFKELRLSRTILRLKLSTNNKGGQRSYGSCYWNFEIVTFRINVWYIWHRYLPVFHSYHGSIINLCASKKNMISFLFLTDSFGLTLPRNPNNLLVLSLTEFTWSWKRTRWANLRHKISHQCHTLESLPSLDAN